MLKQCASTIALLTFAAASAVGALVHSSGMPEGVDKNSAGLIYLEGEKQIEGDTFANEADRERTFFRTAANPADYWGTQVSYANTRCVGRGNDSGSYKNINAYWESISAAPAAGEYDVYAWVLTSTSSDTSTQSFSFYAGADRKAVDAAKPLTEGTTPAKANGWFKVGRVTLDPQSTTFRLGINTNSASVRFDTVLLAPVQHRKGVSVLPRASDAATELEGHIFTADSGQLRISAWSPDDITAGSVTLKNEEGAPLGAVAQLTWQKKDADRAEAVVTLPTPGYYQVNVEVQYRDGQKLTAQTAAGVLGPPLDEKLRESSRYGIWHVHGTTPYIIAAGGRWNRQMTTLKNLERSAIDEAPAGTGTRQPNTTGLEDIGVISFGFPYWMLETVPDPKPKGFANPFTKPRDWNELTALTRAYFLQPKRAAVFPHYYEVWNEPEWAWKGTEDDLVKVHAAIGKGLKEAFPDTKVLGPCFASLNLQKLDRLVQRGLMNYLDGLSMHAYVSGTAPEGQFIQDVRALKTYMKKIGRADMPIYFTEFGWTSHTGTWAPPVDELTQAQYCARSLGLLTHEDIKAIIYFCLLFKTTNLGELGFSVLNTDMTPKPSYVAFSTVSHWLAGTQPEALLEIAPDTYMLTVRRDSKVIAMVWNAREKQTLRLPVGLIRGADMMGRPLALGENAEATIGPSPIYLELASGGFDKIATAAQIRIRQGQDVTLTAPATWCPPPLKAAGGKVSIPENAPYGQYLVFSQAARGWQATPIRVVKPIQIESATMSWPAAEAQPQLVVQAQSALNEPMKVRSTLNLKSVPESKGDAVTLAANGVMTQKFTLTGLTSGKRYNGKVQVASETGKETDSKVVDVNVLPCVHSDSSTVAWDKIPAMAIEDRTFIAGDIKPVDAADCSAKIQLAYSSAGLHMRVQVRDNEHRQTKDAQMLWQEDSLQMGLDLDADLPLQANFGGWNGHQRIFELGVGSDLKTTNVYRWISYDESIPQDKPVTDAIAHVTREGDVTTYDIMYTWKSLGLTSAPKPGSSIGFALVINDKDTDKDKRHGIMLFDGVSGNKDPGKFGRIWLRP